MGGGLRKYLIDNGCSPNYNFQCYLIGDLKMIVKVCKKHGELTENDIKKEKFTYIVNGEKKEGHQLRCLQCRRDKDRKYKLNNPDKHKASASRSRNEQRRLYREGLTDIEPKANIWGRQDRLKNPEKYKEWDSKHRKKLGQLRNTQEVCRRLNWKVEDYYKMHSDQNGKCAICNLEETSKSRTDGKIRALAIDHCHKSGKIRNLLCHDCNTGIGKFKDNIELMKQAILYLEKHA